MSISTQHRRDEYEQPGRPLARPAAPSGDSTNRQVRAQIRRLRGTNTASRTAPPRTVPARQRVGARQLAQITMALSERDRLVLSYLMQHRFLSTHQLQAFVFTDHTSRQAAARTTRRVLARLQRDGLIRPLERRIGGLEAGSAVRIWQLAPAGARVLDPVAGRSWRTHQASPRFLQHSLAVAEAHLALQRGITADRQVTVQTEPLSWRHYTGPGGEAHLIRPDLAACVVDHDAEGVFEDRWFLEVDMGTESIPTVLAKYRRYQAYYRTGIEQAAHGAFPRVLWILHGPRAVERHRALARHLSRTSTLEQRLFRLTSAADLPTALWGSDAPSSPTTS